MKLIYIANARIPSEKAHGLQIIKMCQSFSQQGVDVDLILPERRKKDGETIFKYYNVQENFKVTYIPCIDFLGINFFDKVSFFIQYFSFALNVFFYALLHWNKFRMADVLYFRDEVSPHLLQFINKNIFLEMHAFSKRFYKQKQFFTKKIKGLILVTYFAKDEFVRLGVSSDKILVASDAVDLKIFDLKMEKKEARIKLNLPVDCKIIAYTGKFKTMGSDKGLNDILKTLFFLPKDVIFLAVGGSVEDIIFYQNEAKKMKIEDKVKLIGHVSQDQLAVYQKSADVLLMYFPRNNHYAYYMSPLKLFEYMASKRPIIASDLPSVREILNEKNAVLIEADKPDLLAKGVLQILNNETLTNDISHCAFDDVQQYTWEKRAKNILFFIKKLA